MTYPFIEGDETGTLSKKFSISPEDLWVVNHLEPKPTVFPNTAVLILLTKVPVMDFIVPDPPPPTPAFLPTISNEKKPKSTKSRNLYMAISIAGAILVLVALVACGIKALKKLKGEKFMFRSSLISCSQVRSSPRSANSCLSPDILVEIKYSLFMYSIEDLKKATRDFSEENKIGGEVYKGLINNVEVMIQPTRFENTRWAIDLHSKINHINIVNLHGACYGKVTFTVLILCLSSLATAA